MSVSASMRLAADEEIKLWLPSSSPPACTSGAWNASASTRLDLPEEEAEEEDWDMWWRQ